MNSIIDSLNWRYAVKKFDALKKVSNENLSLLMESINLTATSYGLQPIKVLNIQNREIREKLFFHSWEQRQVLDASHYFVFTSLKKVDNDWIEDIVHSKGLSMNKTPEEMKFYEDLIKNKLAEKTKEEMSQWCSKQNYIALGNVLTVAAMLKIDTCPMEGLDPKKYDEILNLNSTNWKADFALCIGYRHVEDKHQKYKKCRRELSSVVEMMN